jgi:hypothetical protein
MSLIVPAGHLKKHFSAPKNLLPIPFLHLFYLFYLFWGRHPHLLFISIVTLSSYTQLIPYKGFDICGFATKVPFAPKV